MKSSLRCCVVAWMPKVGINPHRFELARFYKLHAVRDCCEPISMIIPRKVWLRGTEHSITVLYRFTIYIFFIFIVTKCQQHLKSMKHSFIFAEQVAISWETRVDFAVTFSLTTFTYYSTVCYLQACVQVVSTCCKHVRACVRVRACRRKWWLRTCFRLQLVLNRHSVQTNGLLGLIDTQHLFHSLWVTHALC